MFPFAKSASFALRLQHENQVTELSFRGYDVVAVSVYIASERDPNPPIGLRRFRGRDEFCERAERDGRVREDGFTRRARF